MCVAEPGRVHTVLDATEFSRPALVQFSKGLVHIDLVLVPDARPGDWVIAHSGYAVARAPDGPTSEPREAIRPW